MTTEPTTDKQTKNWPTILFETEYFLFEKKTGPGQLQTQDLRAPRHNSYLYAKLVENAKKPEYIMNQGRDESRRPDESSGQSC